MKIPEQHRKFLGKIFSPKASLDEFDDQEITRLKKYGHWMDALMRKYIGPITPAQRSFVEMCEGKHPPTNEWESLWCRYRLAALVAEAEGHLVAASLTYAQARERIEKLAQIGSRTAAEWMKKEGDWVDLPSIGRGQGSWEIGALYGIWGTVLHG